MKDLSSVQMKVSSNRTIIVAIIFYPATAVRASPQPQRLTRMAFPYAVERERERDGIIIPANIILNSLSRGPFSLPASKSFKPRASVDMLFLLQISWAR